MMLDALIISHACLTAVNRAPYQRLVKLGWRLELVIPKTLPLPGGLKHADNAVDNDPPIHQLSLTSDNPRLYKFRGLVALLDKKQPRLIFIDNDPACLLSIEIGRWSKRHGSIVICQTCDNLSRTLPDSFKRNGIKGLLSATVIRLFFYLAQPNIAHILVISSAGKKVFQQLGYEKNISQIPLGFDETIFYPNADSRKTTRHHLGLKKITIAYFGRIIAEKGVHLLIKALYQLRNLEWVLLLDEFNQYATKYQKELDLLIKQCSLGARIVYFDASHAEMPKYMNAADIVVTPSITTTHWKEQYGRVVPEAMACGKMVITSNSGTLPELIGDTGIVVAENDIDALTSALQKAIETPALRLSLGDKAEKRALQHLSLACQVRITNNIMQSHLKQSQH